MTSVPDSAAGVAVFCLMRPQPGRTQALHEMWRSQDDFAAHQQRPAVSALFGGQLRDLIAGEVDVRFSTPLPA